MGNWKHTIHAGSIGATVIPGMNGQAVEITAEQMPAMGAGDNYARGYFSYAGSINLSLSTRALYTVLSKFTLTGLTPAMDLAGASNALDLRFARRLNTDEGDAPAGNHISYLFDRGWAFLSGIEVGEGGIPILNVGALPTSATGAAADKPFTRSAVANLAPLPDSRELYRLASLAIDGTPMSRWSGYSVNFNHQAMALRQPNHYWPIDVTFGVGGSPISQVVSFGSEEIDEVWDLAGDVGAEKSITAIFKPLGVNGDLGASQQITATSIGSLRPAAPRGDAMGSAEDRVELQTRYDGTNLPTTITLGA